MDKIQVEYNFSKVMTSRVQEYLKTYIVILFCIKDLDMSSNNDSGENELRIKNQIR
jgi:hypothetical protein